MEIKNKLISSLGNTGEEKLFQSKDSLRLTKLGCKVFCENFDHWTFLLDNRITTGQIIHLQRKMKMPYYFDTKKVMLFSERDAFMAKLGGVDAWIVSK
jgi:hypothetical protein